MGVKRLLLWKPRQESVVNYSHILNEISKCVKTCFHGVENGRPGTTLEYYRPILQDQSKRSELPRHTFGMSLFEQPDKYYFVIHEQKFVAEADTSIVTIMDRLQSYRSTVILKFQAVKYDMRDFQLKLIKVLDRVEILKGILVEIEYLPISSVEVGKPLLEEFIEMWKKELLEKSLPGEFMEAEPNFAEYELSDNYTGSHTAVQYVATLINLLLSWGL